MKTEFITTAQKIGKHLENVARQKKTVKYGDLVLLFGLPSLNGAWNSHPLSEIFEILDQEDAVANRRFRTSVVISANDNSPGPGYFEALSRLKGIPDSGNSNARQIIWISELKSAHEFNWPQL